MSQRHTRLAAALTASWEEEIAAATRLCAIAERVAQPSARARIMVMSSFCRAHASRLLARLSAMGRGPLPVPSDSGVAASVSVRGALLFERQSLQAHGIRYRQMAEVARQKTDLSSAWVCELNLRAALEMVAEIDSLLQGELVESPSQVAGPVI